MPPGLQNPPKNPKIQGFGEIPENPGIPLYSLQLRGGHYVAYYTSSGMEAIKTIREKLAPELQAWQVVHLSLWRRCIGQHRTGSIGPY